MSSSDPKDRIRNVPPPSGSKGTVYSRFIPREEVSSFAAWNPGSLGDAHADAEPVSVQRRSAERRAATAPQTSPAEESAALLHATRQSGYQDGYRDGLAALDAFKQSHAAQMSTQLGALLHSMGGALDSLQQDMARTLAVSATQLARKIVRSELATRPELVAAVAQETIDTLLLSARHITLRVHPDDQPLVALGTADVLAARGARLLADTALQRGGCMVESDIGVIDGSLETRWQRAIAALGCEEPWAADIARQDLPGARP